MFFSAPRKYVRKRREPVIATDEGIFTDDVDRIR
jgi:hypothetical protein